MSGKKKKSPTVVTSAELESRARGATSDAQISSKRIHTGKIIKLDSDRIRYPDGSEAEVDIVRHSGASAVVPFLSDPEGEDPQILLLRQYRYAADGYLYEIPAGRLDPGETPADCAARELKEETGCTAKQMEPLITMVTTPGFTDERNPPFHGHRADRMGRRRERRTSSPM
jgi:ADP-ribose pyrophosphatase